MWFEDIEIGARREIGSYTFTEEAIVAFGRAYDPQPFHVDPEAAKHSMFGGLVASGWHTAAVWMKLMVEDRTRAAGGGGAAMGSGVSPGFEDMRWLKPVRPGMTLTFSAETIEKTPLRSRPQFGLVKSRNEARDESGELVFSFIGKGFAARRDRS